MLDLTVNGALTRIDARTVQDLLLALGIEPGHVAVAVNHACVPRRDFAQRPLAAGDDVEILAPMAGG